MEKHEIASELKKIFRLIKSNYDVDTLHDLLEEKGFDIKSKIEDDIMSSPLFSLNELTKTSFEEDTILDLLLSKSDKLAEIKNAAKPTLELGPDKTEKQKEKQEEKQQQKEEKERSKELKKEKGLGGPDSKTKEEKKLEKYNAEGLGGQFNQALNKISPRYPELKIPKNVDWGHSIMRAFGSKFNSQGKGAAEEKFRRGLSRIFVEFTWAKQQGVPGLGKVENVLDGISKFIEKDPETFKKMEEDEGDRSTYIKDLIKKKMLSLSRSSGEHGQKEQESDKKTPQQKEKNLADDIARLTEQIKIEKVPAAKAKYTEQKEKKESELKRLRGRDPQKELEKLDKLKKTLKDSINKLHKEEQSPETKKQLAVEEKKLVEVGNQIKKVRKDVDKDQSGVVDQGETVKKVDEDSGDVEEEFVDTQKDKDLGKSEKKDRTYYENRAKSLKKQIEKETDPAKLKKLKQQISEAESQAGESPPEIPGDYFVDLNRGEEGVWDDFDRYMNTQVKKNSKDTLAVKVFNYLMDEPSKAFKGKNINITEVLRGIKVDKRDAVEKAINRRIPELIYEFAFLNAGDAGVADEYESLLNKLEKGIHQKKFQKVHETPIKYFARWKNKNKSQLLKMMGKTTSSRMAYIFDCLEDSFKMREGGSMSKVSNIFDDMEKFVLDYNKPKTNKIAGIVDYLETLSKKL